MAPFYCMKNLRIRSFSGPSFPAFGLDTDQNNSEYGHFSRSVCSNVFLYHCVKYTFFFNYFCEYLSYLNIFVNRFCTVEKCGITPRITYNAIH